MESYGKNESNRDPIKILFADDEYMNRLLFLSVVECVQQKLVDTGVLITCNIDIATNGEEALDFLNKNEGNYDVVITDFSMGNGPNGLEVARAAVQKKVRKIIIATGSPFRNEKGENFEISGKLRMDRVEEILNSLHAGELSANAGNT